MDSYAHEVSIDIIGECVTSNATINFLNPISDFSSLQISHEIINVTNKSVLLLIKMYHKDKNYVQGNFTFLKYNKS